MHFMTSFDLTVGFVNILTSGERKKLLLAARLSKSIVCVLFAVINCDDGDNDGNYFHHLFSSPRLVSMTVDF